jgi:hypothetical protein
MDTIKVAQIVVRVCGFLALLFGIMIWIGNLRLTMIHMLLGFLLVLALWTLSVLAIRAKIMSVGITGIIFGLIIAGFGNAQKTIMQGDSHWLIRVLHLILGLAAMGLAESLAKSIRNARGTTATP